MAQGYLYDNGDELISREDVLPATTSASSGDVLSLNSDKKPVWSAQSGGGGGVVVGFDLTSTPVQLDGYGETNFYHAIVLGTNVNATWNTLKWMFDSGVPVIVRSMVESPGQGGTLLKDYKYDYLELTDSIYEESHECSVKYMFPVDSDNPDADLYMTNEPVQ